MTIKQKMGRYVNSTSNGVIMGSSAQSKIEAIRADGGIIIPKPKEWLPELVCVADNGLFGAAGYCYDPNEFRVFTNPSDNRSKTWILWKNVEKFAQ